VVHTRWGKRDLIGRLLDYASKNPGADQWEYIEFPAIMPSGKSLWPEYWPIEELEKIKATIAPHLWNAQYMQNPTGEEGALLKRDWWQDWTKDDPPQCDYVIMSLDAAQEAHNRADYNAVTIWGVFERENENGDKINNVILLEAWRERMEFPELKRAMFKMYSEWNPDTFIVEKKSNGAALYQEMRAAGIPVTEFTPSKGNDKISRVNAVSDMFSSGLIWASKDRRWAQEVMDECAEFPNGDHDDYVDSVTQALIRVRKGGFLRLPMDEEDDPREFRSIKRAGYY
jgi:predicted phage terminase large subunit-like protein